MLQTDIDAMLARHPHLDVRNEASEPTQGCLPQACCGAQACSTAAARLDIAAGLASMGLPGLAERLLARGQAHQAAAAELQAALMQRTVDLIERLASGTETCVDSATDTALELLGARTGAGLCAEPTDLLRLEAAGHICARVPAAGRAIGFVQPD